MPVTIRPFRSVSEYETINLFKHISGVATKGMLVRISSGFLNDRSQLEMVSNPGAAYGNTVSTRWTVRPYVTTCHSGATDTIGMLLYDVAETDENGEKLIFNPQKQAEMQCVLSGQAVPILTRGIVLYSGVVETNTPVAAGGVAYANNFGAVGTEGSSTFKVGRFLGPKDANGHCLLKLEL